jgi:hypothetical protein
MQEANQQTATFSWNQGWEIDYFKMTIFIILAVRTWNLSILVLYFGAGWVHFEEFLKRNIIYGYKILKQIGLTVDHTA